MDPYSYFHGSLCLEFRTLGYVEGLSKKLGRVAPSVADPPHGNYTTDNNMRKCQLMDQFIDHGALYLSSVFKA